MISSALFLAVLAFFWPVWSAGFLNVDDHAYVSENSVVQAGLTRNGVEWAFTGAHVANYHPLTWLSHMLDCQWFGLNPRGHHIVNLLLHAINTVLLFLILRKMTGREGRSAFVAAIFALHPLHVESVAWIAERKDVLSGMFWMLALAAYASYVSRPNGWRYALALLMFALGLLSKPMVVTLPCVLLLLDFWPLRRTAWIDRQSDAITPPITAPRSIGFLLAEKIPFFLLAAASCVATVLAQAKGGAVASIEQMSLGFRLGNSIVSYARYARKFLWPNDLAAFYPLLRSWPMWTVLIATAVLLIITLIACMKWRTRPYLTVGWLWFLGTLVPVIGLVQVGNQSMADRYMYLPLIGLAVMVTWLMADLLERRNQWISLAGAAVVLLALGIVTTNDTHSWRDSETLFTRALERTEPNVFALNNLGWAKALNGNTSGAIKDFEECVTLQPGNPHVRRSLGYALRQAKRYEEAREQLVTSLRIDRSDANSWDALGHVYLEQGNFPKAAKSFASAVERKPDLYGSWINLAVAHRELGEHNLAVQDVQQALKINSRSAMPWYMLGRLYVEAGKGNDAIEPLQQATNLQPNMADAHFQLGLAYMQAGKGADAVGPLMTAVTLEPNSPEPLAKLAWLLATHPDAKLRRGTDAIFLASRANELTQSASPAVLDALAAAMAEQQQFDQAATTAASAAKLARDNGNSTLAARIEQHAQRYREHQATRDASLAGADTAPILP